MASKQKATSPEGAEHGQFWQEPEKRAGLSEKARKWQEENAEAAEAWAKWIEENAEAIRSSNEYVEKHGLPLQDYGAFRASK